MMSPGLPGLNCGFRSGSISGRSILENSSNLVTAMISSLHLTNPTILLHRTSSKLCCGETLSSKDLDLICRPASEVAPSKTIDIIKTYVVSSIAKRIKNRESVYNLSIDKRVNKIRAEEIAATGCDTVAIGCPFCSIMVKDGLDSVGSNMDVKDVAELLWEQIVAKDEEIQSGITTNS